MLNIVFYRCVSALVVRYLTRRFIWEYDPTLEFTYKQQPLIDDELSSLEILDTAGQVNTILPFNPQSAIFSYEKHGNQRGFVNLKLSQMY